MRPRNTDKEQLVKQKAIELLVKEGFEGFSVNKLAKSCDISVATLYIYYQDKEDLILKIAAETIEAMNTSMLDDFDPSLPFVDGLRIQWKNRAKYMLSNPLSVQFLEQLRSSSFHEKIFPNSLSGFKQAMGTFMKNAIRNGEINSMPLEVFWSIAYGPLYTLIRFDNEGRSIGGQPFKLSNKILWQTFELVLKALKK
jgi:TetR/AcrR family transcriptional repressor of multidrug resistance operon